jgi:hypothetical protein
MKLSQMINNQDEFDALVRIGTPDITNKEEFDALIRVGIPQDEPHTTKEVEHYEMDDATKAELEELKSFAGM